MHPTASKHAGDRGIVPRPVLPNPREHRCRDANGLIALVSLVSYGVTIPRKECS
jgi:hypothetical protein